MANHRKEIGFVSKRSINQRYGLNLRFVGGLLALGVVVRKWHQTNKQRSLEGAAYARKHIPLEMSGPHKALKAAMNADSELPAFQSEYNVGYFRLDEANPDLKIAVEVDGCYWHGCKECGYLPPKGMVSNDKRKNTYLAKRGWLVVRIPEHQINRDLASSVTLVLNAVRDRVNG